MLIGVEILNHLVFRFKIDKFNLTGTLMRYIIFVFQGYIAYNTVLYKIGN